jgi:hypothetical protein
MDSIWRLFFVLYFSISKNMGLNRRKRSPKAGKQLKKAGVRKMATLPRVDGYFLIFAALLAGKVLWKPLLRQYAKR